MYDFAVHHVRVGMLAAAAVGGATTNAESSWIAHQLQKLPFGRHGGFLVAAIAVDVSR